MVNICEEYGKEFHVTFNDKKTTGMVFGASNGNCKEALRLEGYKCKKGHFIASVNWFVGNFRGKVPTECYIRLGTKVSGVC